jgi:hypothetical protein
MTGNRKINYRTLGMCLGLVLGIALDNIPVGFCLGIAFGAAADKKTKYRRSLSWKEIKR